MTHQVPKSAVTLLALALGLGVAQAQTAATGAKPAAPPPSEFEQFVKDTKNPVDWLTWGADLRLRNEYQNSGLSLDSANTLHEQDYFRFRARVWTTITPVTNVSLNARVAAEPRLWMRDSFASQYRNSQGVPKEGMEWRYGIADNLNVKWNNIADQPLSITAGRQDIMLGDPLNWWLVADGTPGDGSWTFFLDSIRVGYDAKDIKTKFDVIYIYQNANPDALFPTIGDPEFNQYAYTATEQNEQGVVVYASNKSVENVQIDGYFMYKGDDYVGDSQKSRYMNGDDANIYTFGAKVTGIVQERWKYSLEGAYQFGNKKDVRWEEGVTGSLIKTPRTDSDLSAFGVNTKLTYLFKDKLNNQPYLFYEFLSGDDPSTSEDEMFDMLWGRWPRWSELYIYSYAPETSGKIAQLNNLHRLGLGWSVDPRRGMNFLANYSAMFSDQEVPTRAAGRIAPGAAGSLFTADGIFRGHYIQAVLKQKFNDHISAHLWSEFIWMGDYYAHRDLMTFLRAEVLLTW